MRGPASIRRSAAASPARARMSHSSEASFLRPPTGWRPELPRTMTHHAGLETGGSLKRLTPHNHEQCSQKSERCGGPEPRHRQAQIAEAHHPGQLEMMGPEITRAFEESILMARRHDHALGK